MLRNILLPATIRIPYVFLNEVLSLNDQESVEDGRLAANTALLNEVLSLNAQEFARYDIWRNPQAHLLNEVLSLNAQELVRMSRMRSSSSSNPQ